MEYSDTQLWIFFKVYPVKGSHVFTCFYLLPCHKPLPISVWIMLYIIKYIFFECTYTLLDNIRISWLKRVIIIVKILNKMCRQICAFHCDDRICWSIWYFFVPEQSRQASQQWTSSHSQSTCEWNSYSYHWNI